MEKENISVYYSSNVPLEREVVERLLKGPKSAGLKPTLSPNTKILSVSIVEGICYVNLDKSFLTDSMDVQEELPIFSIVNSLTDACNVRGVQISVDGKTAVNFRESMKLDQIYHADYRLTEENQEEKEERKRMKKRPLCITALVWVAVVWLLGKVGVPGFGHGYTGLP